MNPYSQPMPSVKDISPYFRKNKDGSMTFTGETLDVIIPKAFSKYGSLTLGDGKVITLGVCGLIFNKTHRCGLNILASVTIEPTDMSQATIDGVDYQILHLVTGDTFLASTRVLQDQQAIYVLWSEFITAGHYPFWLNYKDMLNLFQNARELTGAGIGVTQSVFEGIIAQLARDRDDIRIKYRLTDMTKPMKFVALKSISQATENTSSKLIGNYFKDDGLTSALRYEAQHVSPFENILRGLPNVPVNESLSDEAS